MKSYILLLIIFSFVIKASHCYPTIKDHVQEIKEQISLIKSTIDETIQNKKQLNFESIIKEFSNLTQQFIDLRSHLSKHTQGKYPSFAEYVIKFDKTYSDQEYRVRQVVYQANIAKFKYIKDFVPGINKFTDWTQEQVKKLSNSNLLLLENRISSQKIQHRLGNPSNLDWRQKNVVTAIKDQGSCGSCWTFSSAGVMQSYLVKNKKQSININLSEQYILQCTESGSCQGGAVQYGLDKIAKQCPEQDQFPYIAPDQYGDDICDAKGIQTKAKRKSYYDITDKDLINLLQNGPVSVSVDTDSSTDAWMHYSGQGVIKCSSSSRITHAIIAVGYTEDAYIIKNSWGTAWGQNGFAYVSRNPSQNCLITKAVHVLYGTHLMAFVGLLLMLWAL